MGQLVEVVAVEVEEAPIELLLGASVDTPAPGRRLSAHAVEIGGWALGREEAVGAIEVTHSGEVLGRAAVAHPRADIGTAYPGVDGAANAGFEVEVDAGGLPVEAELGVRVGVGSATVPVARLRLRRYWRGQWEGRPPLVTVVVTGDSETTTDSLAAQRYPLTELVLLDTAGGGSPAAARNEAIRRSEGELILFLPAGVALADRALANGVGRLAAAGGAAALIDAEPGGAIAALYRRAAFEELEGFAESAPDCDRELAERAAGLDALFEPGSLRESEG